MLLAEIEPTIAEPRNLLRGIAWETYERLVADVGEKPALRLTYDDGVLEIMTTSSLHEILKRMLGRVIEMLCFELAVPHKSGGSFTHRREDLLKGIEPDECYWIAGEPQVRSLSDIDLSVHPPPDLAVEIDVTRSWLDRMAIYASLGIPEVWRYNGRELAVFLRQTDGAYCRSESSSAFPFLPVAELAPFLDPNDGRGELERIQAFVEWIRERNFAPSGR